MDRRYSERHESSQTALNAALQSQRQATDAALIAADRAVLKAETASEKRFESINEFRGSLSDQQRTLMPRSEAEAVAAAQAAKLSAAVATLEDKIQENTKRVDTLRSEMGEVAASGRGGAVVWGYVVGGFGMLLGIVSALYAVLK